MSRGGKMDKLVEMLTEMDSNHQRTLIFVETKKLADVVAGRLSDEEKMSATATSTSHMTMKEKRRAAATGATKTTKTSSVTASSKTLTSSSVATEVAKQEALEYHEDHRR